MDGRLELRLLGTPAVTLNGLPVELKLKKAQAVLYYLALSRGPLLRPVLAGLLWGDMPEEAAATNLRKAVAELRAALGDCVETSREAVGLRCGDALWVDVLAFEAGAGSREPARLEEALALYRGEFLAGFYVREAPDFEQWVAGERTRLRELALAALQALARGHAAAGDVAGAIAATRRMLALEPWCEEAHRELMRLLAASGQRSAALAQYEACRRALRDELDVEPDPATRRLYDEIRRGVAPPEPAVPVAPPGEPTAAPTPAVSLPPEPTPFVGRENELALLAGQLADPGCRLLTITGPGGTGKTRLAIRAAAAQAQAWPDGVYFVDLAPLGDVHLLPVTILRALAVPPSPVIEPREQLLRFLQDKHLLLLLDNFEHLLEGAGLLPELLAAAPKLKLLATSRLRLDLREEWLAPLAGLELPPGEGALPIWATLEDYSATRLFLQCVRRLRPGYRPADADVPEVVRICRLLDGLPLGLELAAAWTRTLSLPAIAAELARGLDLLATTLRDVPPRQRSLRATFDHSWRLLSARERGILRQLAVFRGGFTREAAAAVAGATLGDLAGLADASWLA